MRIFVLLDSFEEGENILFLSTDRATIENKRLDIELHNSKAKLEIESWKDQFNVCKEAAGFGDEEFPFSAEFDEWQSQYFENFPYPDIDMIWLLGELVIREYKCI